MADEGQNQAGTPAPDADPVKNVKSEFDRKIQAIQEQIAEQNRFNVEQFNQILSAVKTTKPSEPDTSDKDIENLAFNEPAKYAKLVEDRARVAAESAATRMSDAQSARQNMIIQLAQEYPELNDPSTEFYQKVSAQSKSLGSNYTPSEAKALIREVAADVGLLPKAKRQTSNAGDFSFGGSRGGAGSGADRSKKAEVSADTLLVAQLLGRDIKDPKVLKGLEEATKRDTYNKYR